LTSYSFEIKRYIKPDDLLLKAVMKLNPNKQVLTNMSSPQFPTFSPKQSDGFTLR